MFYDFGSRGSIAQDARGSDLAFLNAVWAAQITQRFLLGLILALSATPVAAFYDMPILTDLLFVSTAWSHSNSAHNSPASS